MTYEYFFFISRFSWILISLSLFTLAISCERKYHRPHLFGIVDTAICESCAQNIEFEEFKQDIDARISHPLSLALSRYRSWSFNLKTAFHAFKLHAKVASSIPFLPFISLPLSSRPISFRLLSYPRYIFARFLHSSSFEPSEKGFVREPFIFSRVSRPDASGPTFRW